MAKPKNRKVAPPGVDLALLTQVPGSRKLKFEYAEFTWEFEYHPITWQEHWEGIEKAWIVNEAGDDTEFDTKGYYLAMLLTAQMAVPGGDPLTEKFLIELDPPVFAKLTGVIPSPNLDREVERVKKE